MTGLDQRSGWKVLRDFFVQLFVGGIVLSVTIWLTPGIGANRPGYVLVATLVYAVVGAILRPLLLAVSRPFGWVGAILLALFANATVMAVTLWLTPGIVADRLLSVVTASWIFSMVAAAMSWLLVADSDELFVDRLVRDGRRAAGQVAASDVPGVVFIQIDGLPGPVLDQGIKAGTLPTLARWVRSGSHQWSEWDVQVPSTTPVSQAGLLHGYSEDMPAFRWYEKALGRLLVANHPPDAALMEGRISDGAGLLAGGGWSISNLFSGDADHRVMVMSSMSRGVEGLGPAASFASFLVRESGFGRSMVLTVGEMVKELYQRRLQRVRRIEPRMHRGKDFVVLRGATNVMLRDLNTALLVQGMMSGAPTLYADYVDYDEVAHHAGILRSESLRSVEGVDRTLAVLEAAAERAPRPYRFVVVSDHGQSQGATFRQRYGTRLEDVVRELMGGTAGVLAATEAVEGWGPVNAALGQLMAQSGRLAAFTRRRMAAHEVDGAAALGAAAGEYEAVNAAVATSGGDDLVVVGSGNLGGIWFTGINGQLAAEDLAERFPGMVRALVAHPGVGFVVVNSRDVGPMALGKEGVHYLATGEVDGTSPIARFGPDAVADFARAVQFRNAPDIYLNSLYDANLDEVAAFEELVGCHGGIGGWQTRAVLVHPADWEIDRDLLGESGRLHGAETVHRQLVRWLERAGTRPVGLGPTRKRDEVPRS
ncbi:MAG: phage holin family protein [Candidatus Nanopelagicales bacterium]